MERKNILRNQQGFTLVEIIAVLILLGILAAVAVPKYIDMTNEAKNKAVDAGISELNSRESLLWGKVMLASGTVEAGDVFGHDEYDTDLGSEYVWEVGPDADGGSLSFQEADAVALTRTGESATSPGKWARID